MIKVNEILQQKIRDFNLAEQQGKVITEIDYSLEGVRAQYPDIQPTDKEMYQGYLYAFEKATRRISLEEMEKRKQALRDELERPWTYEECYANFIKTVTAVAEADNFEFVIDEHNEKAIELLCLYFTNDPKFETHYVGKEKKVFYSLKKGICLQSPTRGVGKSVMLRSFALNKRSSFVYMHLETLRTLYSQGGFDNIENRIGLVECSPTNSNFLQSQYGFMYDELFDEKHANYMGNPIDISHYIISKLYDQQKGKDWFWKFHCTTNFDGDAIEAKCGKATRSRFGEMFNIIKLGGPDRRLKIQ